jgi:CheY-like chemotaxis protein
VNSYAPGSRKAEKIKVLIVDDDMIALSITQMWLQVAGYEVITHGGSFGAAAVIHKHRPDFVLLDINMPGLHGDALAALINRKDDGGGPGIVLFSSDDVTESRKRAQKAGVLGAVQKGSDRQQFLTELEKCFAIRQVRR